MEADSDRQDQNVSNNFWISRFKSDILPAQLGGSYLFNEIKKRTPKSSETDRQFLRYRREGKMDRLLTFGKLVNNVLKLRILSR
jgi:hypothetical protein